MAFFAAPIVIPVGTAIMTGLSYLFRVAMVKFLVGAVIVALVAAGGYWVASWLLPSWFSVETLRDAFGSLSPSLGYALHLMSFYEGAPLLMFSLATAWVVKKLPGWVWLGPLWRLFNPGSAGPT